MLAGQKPRKQRTAGLGRSGAGGELQRRLGPAPRLPGGSGVLSEGSGPRASEEQSVASAREGSPRCLGDPWPEQSLAFAVWEPHHCPVRGLGCRLSPGRAILALEACLRQWPEWVSWLFILGASWEKRRPLPQGLTWWVGRSPRDSIQWRGQWQRVAEGSGPLT